MVKASLSRNGQPTEDQIQEDLDFTPLGLSQVAAALLIMPIAFLVSFFLFVVEIFNKKKKNGRD